jgi:hypothetical protein
MAIFAIPEILAALLCAILILALGVLAFIVAHTVPNLPLIGGALRNAIVSAVNAAGSVLRGWADDVMVPIAFTIQGVALVIWWIVYIVGTAVTVVPSLIVHYYDSAVGWTNDVYNWAVAESTAIIHLAYVLYNQAVAVAAADTAAAERFTSAVEGAVVSYADTLYNDAVTVAARDVAGLEVTVVGWVDSLTSEINTLDNALTGGLAGLASTVTAEITREAAQAQAEIAAAIISAEAVASSLASVASAGAIGALDKSVADVLNPALKALEDDLGVVATALGGAALAIPGLEQLLANPTVAGTAAGLAALGAAVGAIAKELTECVTPYCASLSKLDALLKALENVALWAALLALLIEAAHDPGALVRDVEGGLATLARDTASSFRALVGI